MVDPAAEFNLVHSRGVFFGDGVVVWRQMLFGDFYLVLRWSDVYVN